MDKNYSIMSDEDELIQDEGQFMREGTEMLEYASTVCTLVMVWMCICGTIGNALSLYIYHRPSFRNRSINTLLAALSATDLFLCILAIPVFSLSQIQHYCAGLSRIISGHILLFAYPVTLMFQSMSVWLLVGITIDRYLAVCHPFTARVYCTKHRARLTVIIIVVFSIAYNFVRFWEFRIDEAAGHLSIEDSIVPELRANPLFMLLYQNIATLVTQFFIPLIVLCYLNLHVAQTILDATEQRKQLVASEKREYSIAKMMIFVVIVFIFCYTLSMVLNLIEILHEEVFRHPIGYLLNDVNNILVVINSSSSFIFYTKYSTRFRAQLHSIWFIRWFAARLPCCYDSVHDRSRHDTKCVSIRGSFMDSASTYCEAKHSRADLIGNSIGVPSSKSNRSISCIGSVPVASAALTAVANATNDDGGTDSHSVHNVTLPSTINTGTDDSARTKLLIA